MLRGDAEQHQRPPRRAPLNSRKQSAMCVLLFLVIVAYLQADSMSNSWFSPPLCGLRLPADGLREERALSRDSGVIVNADVCVCVCEIPCVRKLKSVFVPVYLRPGAR